MSSIRRLAVIPCLAALLTLAPACSATAGNKWGKAAPSTIGSNPQRRVSLRPLFDPSRAKQYYLGGYAGANYARTSPGGLAYPTTYKQATNLGPHSTFNFPWPGK